MELQAAILLVVSFALLLMFSVPVSYSIVASAFITITAFLTPQFGMFVSAQKVIAGIDRRSILHLSRSADEQRRHRAPIG